MGPVEELLASVRPEVEERVVKALKGIGGPLLRSYLPQVWVFETGREIVSFVIDVSGKAIVEGREWRPRDVTVRWKEELLVQALRTRSRAGIPPREAPRIECHTPKGCAAMNFLRSKLGL